MSTRAPAEVFPPGETLREELEARNWTQVDLGEIIGRNARFVNKIVMGKRSITPETARDFAAAFGTSADCYCCTVFALPTAMVEDEAEYLVDEFGCEEVGGVQAGDRGKFYAIKCDHVAVDGEDTNDLEYLMPGETARLWSSGRRHDRRIHDVDIQRQEHFLPGYFLLERFQRSLALMHVIRRIARN